MLLFYNFQSIILEKYYFFSDFRINSLKSTIFKFIWNKKWQGKCPDRINGKLSKSYKNWGMKATQSSAKHKFHQIQKIKALQGVFSATAAPVSMRKMVYDPKMQQNLHPKSITNNK